MGDEQGNVLSYFKPPVIFNKEQQLFAKNFISHQAVIIKNLEIKFEQADVTQLQYADKQFDIVSISFGIRNVSDPVKALTEMARVTKPGGRVMVLEFGQMTTPVIKDLYNIYSEKVLPALGGMVTGQKEAYDYLQKSSAAFPCRDEFLALMKKSDCFSEMSFVPVSFGIAYIYTGVVN